MLKIDFQINSKENVDVDVDFSIKVLQKFRKDYGHGKKQGDNCRRSIHSSG